MADREYLKNYISNFLLIDKCKVIVKHSEWSRSGYYVTAEVEIFVPHKTTTQKEVIAKCQDCGTSIPEGHKWCEECFAKEGREVI